MSDENTKNPLSYKDAGVNIDAGNALVERIKGAVSPHYATGSHGWPWGIRRSV